MEKQRVLVITDDCKKEEMISDNWDMVTVRSVADCFKTETKEKYDVIIYADPFEIRGGEKINLTFC